MLVLPSGSAHWYAMGAVPEEQLDMLMLHGVPPVPLGLAPVCDTVKQALHGAASATHAQFMLQVPGCPSAVVQEEPGTAEPPGMPRQSTGWPPQFKFS